MTRGIIDTLGDSLPIDGAWQMVGIEIVDSVVRHGRRQIPTRDRVATLAKELIVSRRLFRAALD
jgi:hypothetical protein